LLAALAIACGCGAPRQADTPLVVHTQAPVRSRPPDAAIADGVKWLLDHQRPGGYWGTGCWSWGYDIYGTVPGAQQAFKAGTTGLCAMALREAGTPEALAAARRAELWLATDGTRIRRIDEDEIYNIWGHIYALQALAGAVRGETDPALVEKLRAGAAIHVDMLGRYQSAYGGWNYYDFAAHTRTPSLAPTSFATAAGLVALRAARDAGIEVPETMIRRSVRLLEHCRLGNNCYLYSFGHRYRPRHVVNQVPGSLGRTQAGNDALLEWASPKVTLDDARNGLKNLFEKQGFLECGRKRPIPHEAYYAVAGYFYYFGHYYAARLIALLPKEERAPWAARLSKLIRSHQEDDGCWWDYNAIWDFHKPYGTAYALMILLRCRAEAGDPVQ